MELLLLMLENGLYLEPVIKALKKYKTDNEIIELVEDNFFNNVKARLHSSQRIKKGKILKNHVHLESLYFLRGNDMSSPNCYFINIGINVYYEERINKRTKKIKRTDTFPPVFYFHCKGKINGHHSKDNLYYRGEDLGRMLQCIHNLIYALVKN